MERKSYHLFQKMKKPYFKHGLGHQTNRNDGHVYRYVIKKHIKSGTEQAMQSIKEEIER